MTFNRSQIMKEAWEIVRRFEGNGEPFNQLMSRALKAAWFNAKAVVATQCSCCYRPAPSLGTAPCKCPAGRNHKP